MSDVARHSDAPGDAAGGVLVIGYGNTLRSDDGVGWHAASLLAADPRLVGDVRLARDVQVPDVEVRAVHQLTPELALDFSRVSLVVLIDASTDDPPGTISVEPLAPGEPAGDDTSRGTGARAGDRRAHGTPASRGRGGAPGASRGPGVTSHHVGPAELLALARALYGAAPRAFVVRVGVADMEVGEALSPAVAAALPDVADVVVDLVARYRGSPDIHTPR